MSGRMKALGIDHMSIEERLALMREILDSITEEHDGSPLTEPQRTELERRIAASKKNPEDGIPWEEIRAAALAR